MDGEMKKIVEGLEAHLTWLSDAGVRQLPIPPTFPAPMAPSAGKPGKSAREPPTAAPLPAQASRERAPTAARLPLPQIREELGDCRRCKLHAGRTNIVFGVGNPQAELVFVGEGPGADEDRRGEPFVGAAGQLLDKMIAAMGLARSDVYICNVVKCRPPGNRNPEPDEIAACAPFLRQQVASIQPKVIVALGKFAAQFLLSENTPITRLRGRWREYDGIPLMPTFHPAYLLRSPGEKGKAWEDLKAVLKALGRELPAGR
ncbi:MAG: uracil-DNA glycosylase [Myxococcales bacterium]